MRQSQNKTITLNLISMVVLQALTFISAPIFSGILGTNSFGIVSVYNTWASIASISLTLQAGSAIAVARTNFPIEDQKKYQSSVLCLAGVSYFLISSVIIVVIYLFRSIFQPDYLMIFCVLAHGFGMYCVNFLSNVCIYEFKADKNLLLSVSTSVSTILFSIVLIYVLPEHADYWGRILGQAGIYLILGIFICFIVFKAGGTLFNKEYWMYTLPITVPTVFHSLSNVILSQSDRIMLQKMVDNSSVGIYSLAATFAGVMHSLWFAFNNSWSAFYYEYTRKNEIEKIKEHSGNYIRLFTVLTCGFILLTPEVYHIFAGKEYWSGTNIIPIYALGYFFLFLYSFAVNFEFYNKKTKRIATATSLAAVLNIILNFVLIRFYSILGAVISTAISYLFQFVIHHIFARKIKELKYPFHLKDFSVAVMIVCVVIVIFYLPVPWLVRWAFAFVMGLNELGRMIRRKAIF